MNKPTDIKTLIEYLKVNPRVNMTPPRGCSENRRFIKYEDNAINWEEESEGRPRWTPMKFMGNSPEDQCTSKIILTFKDSGFYVHAFSSDWWFSYLPNKESERSEL